MSPCMCVCVYLCIVGEKTLIVEAVLVVQQLSERERWKETEAEGEWRKTSLSDALWPFS